MNGSLFGHPAALILHELAPKPDERHLPPVTDDAAKSAATIILADVEKTTDVGVAKPSKSHGG